MQVLRFDQLVNPSPQLEELCKCMICLEIFIDPMCCESCENHFCQTCLTTQSQNQSARSCPDSVSQKICLMILQIKWMPINFEIFLILFSYQIILFQINILLKERNQHYNICPFKLLQCRWCSKVILRKKLEQHELNECLQRKVQCGECLSEVSHDTKSERQMPRKYCNININYLFQHKCQLCLQHIKLKDLKFDDNNECPEVIIKCSGCQEQLKRTKIIQHRQSCNL
ncbi:unnamed protein product (macronuclear) [Paramecium tetraurelia]|uniref:TRAF-type domain-containing protein n=1 Tax=Paramecium tetraurelia TaxID=5888 RepID=A0CI75_PARTE|nr:uncharacterized protein GSPATT00007627001 [Paramecium tetraurelia]CAK70492.1 unnamed protein product [Paramecium tetraurelia]|eukprot:XP_001437889.1 hypothetical protein (macronuclear) [Paramecium tetraurelia strain d4-2]